MWPSLLDILVDPISKGRFELSARWPATDEGEVERGTLRSEGRTYAIEGAIPRFVGATTPDQTQTGASFGYKWQQRSSYESPEMLRRARQWLVQRYGFVDAREMTSYLASANRILDAGCGSGFSTACWMDDTWATAGDAQWYGADISAAIDVARQRIGTTSRLHYLQADVSQLPFADESFDVIISEGVLHHTPSTSATLHALVPLVRRGGEIMFYVYRRKSPIREFTDDHIRAAVSGLDPEEAWAALEPLTELGRAFAQLKATIEVPRDVPYLGIPAGTHDVQRLLYWHFAKMFWNDELTFDENHHINFDWYHPRYAHRHTEGEVREWCEREGLAVSHFDTTNESGFTVRAVRS